MKAVYEVWVQEFYRRNFLLFFLCLCLLAFVFRPPTLLISPLFITPMLSDGVFLGIVCLLIGLYYVKCIRECFKRLSMPENRFLYSLGAMEKGPLFGVLIKVLAGVMAPGMFYMAVIAAYSAYHGTWHIWAILGVHMALFWGIGNLLMDRIHRPREISIRSGFQHDLEQKVRKSLSFIQLQMIGYRKRRQFLVLKGISLFLLGLAVWSEVSDPFTPKGLDLVFLCIICLQSIYAYTLRREEDQSIFILRNLPISRWKRYLAYLLTGAILFFPEFLLWVSAIPGTHSLIQALGYVSLGLGIWMLGIVLLYYQAMELPDFIQWIFGAFMVLFVLILFGVNAMFSGLLLLLFSSWIFFEEYYKWNGFKKV